MYKRQESIQAQFGGYGSHAPMIQKALDRLKGLPPLEKWDDEWITRVVKSFMMEKFPTVLALNKIDHPDADKNVSKIMLKYPDTKAVPVSYTHLDVYKRQHILPVGF